MLAGIGERLAKCECQMHAVAVVSCGSMDLLQCRDLRLARLEAFLVGKIAPCLGIVGAGGDGGFKLRDGFVRAAERGKRDAHVVERGGKVRAKRQGLFKVAEGLRRGVQAIAGIAEIVERFGVIRLQRQRSSERMHGFLVVPERIECIAHIVVIARDTGSQGQRLTVRVQRLLTVAERGVAQTFQCMQQGHLRMLA